MTAQPRKSSKPREREAAVSLSWVDKLPIPDRDQIAFYGGVAALAAFGFLEFPVAAVVAVGHMLTHQRTNQALTELGEALEQV
jgi:hypothetical protein